MTGADTHTAVSSYTAHSATYRSVEVPPCFGDGNQADFVAAPSDSFHDVFMLQRLYRLPVDGQEQVPVLHAGGFSWTPCVHIPQNMN